MDISTERKKQYYINLLRQPTVILLTPHIIKRAVLLPIYYEYRTKNISMRLVNTKLLKQVIKNSRFSILSPAVNNHLILSTLTKKLTTRELLTLINELAPNFTFICALMKDQIITSERIRLIENNVHKSFYSLVLTYLLFFVYISKLNHGKIQ